MFNHASRIVKEASKLEALTENLTLKHLPSQLRNKISKTMSVTGLVNND